MFFVDNLNQIDDLKDEMFASEYSTDHWPGPAYIYKIIYI